MNVPDIFHFDFVDVDIPEFDELSVKSWLFTVLREEDAMVVNIQYVFCNDEMLWNINKKYLNHETLTDIITFNYNDEYDNGIAGDIFISYTRVINNAKEYNVPVKNELYRVMVHGILHLLGYDDQDTESQLTMRSKEDYYLSKIN